VINAVGVYTQLVATHASERDAAASALETQAGSIDAKLESQIHVVADLDRRLGQIDAAMEEATRRDRTKAAMATMEGQQRARAALVDERKREAGAQPSRPGATAWPRKAAGSAAAGQTEILSIPAASRVLAPGCG
jgi:hypothetical protein